MIVFDLACANGHRFEGWFQSADEFRNQQTRQLVCCPRCDSHDVRRVPSPVAIGANRTPSAESAAAWREPRAETVGRLQPATEVMAIYRQFVQALLANSEDVGNGFAAEARRIHTQESPARAIHGNASEDECEALRDDGIPVLRLAHIEGDDLN